MSVPVTNPSLLKRLRSPEDQAAWTAFVDLYTPLLLTHALRRGCPPSDVEDVVQDAMRNIFLALPRFDYRPLQVKFRSWLYRVIENQVRQYFRRRSRRPEGAVTPTARERADAEAALLKNRDAELAWAAEYECQLFRWAAQEVRPEFAERSWQAFWRTAVENEAPEAVATDLGMTKAAVYMARSRCVARLREFLQNSTGPEFDLPVTDG